MANPRSSSNSSSNGSKPPLGHTRESAPLLGSLNDGNANANGNAAELPHGSSGARDASSNEGVSGGQGLCRVFLVAIASTLCSVAFGYDVGVVSGCLADMTATLHLSQSTTNHNSARPALGFAKWR